MPLQNIVSLAEINAQVTLALQEDIGEKDLTADLIPLTALANASLISRETGVLSGQSWFEAVFSQLDNDIHITWLRHDGDVLAANDIICRIQGPARQILTGERTAMNFLQTLSGTATLTRRYAEALKDLPVHLLDTRKTVPGLRLAQKYAVRCGGGMNHRIGLFDGILIKENHIMAAGSILAAVKQARQLHPNIAIEVEVENETELQQALAADTDIILLDNFSLDALRNAVKLNVGKAQLEASGGITLDNIRQIAQTGVHRISVGALTKDVKALDLSLRFD